VASIAARRGLVALVAAISPFRKARLEARQLAPLFLEVYVNAPLEVCEKRDPKGLYRLARSGELANFTGISSPYEPPSAADLECLTGLESVDQSVTKVLLCISGVATKWVPDP
jgi:adenylylsulfate kinase